MTNIILHGILAKEFGESFRMKINKAANVVKAIDVNRRTFNKRIFELSREGLNYTMIVDGKKITELEELNIQKEPQEIHLVPLIMGSGGFFAVALYLGTTAGAVMAGGGVAFAVASVINAVILTVVSVGLQMLLAPKPDAGPQISATTKALKESFNFSNKSNVAAQGVPVPVGYGRLKVGSQLIQMSIKSYPQSSESTIAMTQNAYISTTTAVSELSQSISNRE
jgi:predicted phage tail protein